MKLAIGHYHLNRGGVTRVIENQLLALDRVLGDGSTHEALILYGGRCEGWPTNLADRLERIRLRLQPLPEFDYDSEQSGSPGDLESRLLEALRAAGFRPANTIVHFHNPSIGKNAALPRAVWALADRGYGLLLQIHDFAEDQRPVNFRLLADASVGITDWHGRLYPQAPNVHFAVLNGRDRGILQSVGLPPGQLHFLPNPVLSLSELPDRETSRAKLNDLFGVPVESRLLLYPVRGIRRKNLGEALLHSLLAPERTFVSLTLPPLNPAEWPQYKDWKASAQRWELPFRFDVGAPGGLSFAENISAADMILTTSVAEGFGMVYLESWLAHRPLAGRDLPEITQDFAEAGVDLSRLSGRLEVPTDWIDCSQLRQALLNGFRATIAAYDRAESSDLPAQIDARLGEDCIDFGDLDESFQAAVIDRIVAEKSAREELRALNPWIEEAAGTDNQGLVRSNADVVRREFSLQPSGLRLLKTYESVLDSPRGREIQPLDQPNLILDGFLDFERFRLLRS